MKTEVETTIRTVALAAGILPDRVEAGIAQMKDEPGTGPEPVLFLNELAKHPEIRMHPTMLWKLGVKSVSFSFGGRPRYRLQDVLIYLRSPECAAMREKLRQRRREREGGLPR